MFVTNWISTTKIQKISEITNFFRHYFLSRTEVIIIRIFAAREPAKPLDDAQMRGAFFFYNSSMSKYIALVCLLSSFLSESKR